MVNPTSLPIYFRLHSREPWVAEDGFVLAEVGEKELERDSGRAGSHIQDGVVAEVSTSVFGSVDVEQLTRLRELFDGEF